ncbi:hypothetical protein EXIGLDRAFT_721763 [Exidia glandulosa HHB12029]|uniref:Uncharacterized protein n=1 Tax=Exidia glandulosa HHB12029 TaxID=1314781 RepID=A0A165QG12_EXIGL|nr:hypothetical protein EXIGLDRAFT_721763 [Exidia glandulosa HHB12029]
MSWKEQISHFVEKGQHFIEHNGVEILQQANLQGLHKTINNFDYDDVQDWGLSHINDYVDGLHPDISGFLAKEVTKLEDMLLDSLEGHVIGVFDHTFKDRSPGDLFHDKKSLNSYSKPHEESEPRKSRGPSKYGEAGNAFEHVQDVVHKKKGFKSKMKGFAKFVEQHGDKAFDKAKDKMEDAVDDIQDHAEDFGHALDKIKDATLEGVSELLGKIVKALKGIMENIRDKAVELVQWLRDAVSTLLRELNRGLADAFTTAALTCLKNFLRENTEWEDLERAAGKAGKGIQESAMSLLSGIIDTSNEGNSKTRREAVDAMKPAPAPPQNAEAVIAVDAAKGNPLEAGVAAVLSGKLSNGYAQIREETREEFRTILSALETLLLDMLPTSIMGPLTKLFDGDPITVGEQRDEKSGHFLKELFHDLVENIQQIAHDILMAIKNTIFAAAAGSYEVLERVAWKFVQETTVAKMKVYLPSLEVKNLDQDAY